MSGQVYALASGKGGVGKTTVAVNLGVTLRANRHSVVLVDADLGMANLATLLGIEPAVTVHDVLAGEATVEEALSEEASGFAVLPGRRDLAGFAAADPDGLGAVLDALAEAYDFVLVDTGAGISYEDVLPLGVVDGTILVTTPDDAAVGDTAKTIEMVHLLDGEAAGVVVNRATEATDPGGVAARLGIPLLGTIPEDGAVTESGRAGQPIKQYDPDSPATAAFGRLAETLGDAAGAGEEPATDNWQTSSGDTEDGDGTESSARDGATAEDATAEPDPADHEPPADGRQIKGEGGREADTAEGTEAPGGDATGKTAASEGDPADERAEQASEPDESGDGAAVTGGSAADDSDGADTDEPDAGGPDAADPGEKTVEDRDGEPTTAGGAAADERAEDAEDGEPGEAATSPGTADGTTAGETATASDGGESPERTEADSGGRFGWLSRIFG